MLDTILIPLAAIICFGYDIAYIIHSGKQKNIYAVFGTAILLLAAIACCLIVEIQYW